MKKYKFLCALLCALLALCLGACSGQVLTPGEDQTTGEFATGALITDPVTSGNAGTLNPGDCFADAEHLLTIRVLKTGKSDCMLIMLDQTVIMIDTADADDFGEICAELAHLGVSRIDHLILTHYDNDHIGSAAGVIEDFEVTNVYAPNYVRDSGLYRSLIKALEDRAAVTTFHKLGEDSEIALPTGKLWINVSRVYPELSHAEPIPKDNMDNNLSLICGLTLGNFSALFMGDAEKARCEDFNAQTQYAGEYDFIKLPHHGNHTKGLRETIIAAKPKYSVICTDASSSVELELVYLLRDMGALSYYSYDGTFVLYTDGERVECAQ